MSCHLAIVSPARSAPALRPALGGLLAVAVGIGVGRFVYTPILPPMMAGLGMSQSVGGAIASANFAGYFAGALFAAGPWAPGSRRTWLLGALGVSALSTAAMGLLHGLVPFVAMRFVGGAASALVLILATALVLERISEAGRPDLSAVLFAGVGVGIAVSAALVAVLRRVGMDWPALWLGSGILSLAGALGAAVFLPREPPPRPGLKSARRAPPGQGLLRMAAAYGLFGFGYVITATFLVAIVRAEPDIRPLEPVAWVVFGLAAIPSVALWTALARRIGVPRAFAVAAVTEALGVLASVGWPGAGGVIVAGVLVGGTFMGLTALGLMHGRAMGGDDPRRVLALMTGAFGLGQIVGPGFAGLLSDRLGSLSVPSVVAAAALLGAAILAAMERDMRETVP